MKGDFNFKKKEESKGIGNLRRKGGQVLRSEATGGCRGWW
jgi:hypothetical protein